MLSLISNISFGGSEMVSQVLIRVDKELKDKFRRLSRTEQKSVNEKVRELMEEYVKEHDMEAAMKSLWDEIGQSLKKKGYKASDVGKRIKEVRTGR
jgi:predicted DNA-binding protein